MYFQREERNSENFFVESHHRNSVIVKKKKYSLPICIFTQKEPVSLAVCDGALPSEESFLFLMNHKLDILLWGVGSSYQEECYLQYFLMAEKLTEKGLPCDVMSTPSACRTFNALCLEGRRVAAALF